MQQVLGLADLWKKNCIDEADKLENLEITVAPFSLQLQRQFPAVDL